MTVLLHYAFVFFMMLSISLTAKSNLLCRKFYSAQNSKQRIHLNILKNSIKIVNTMVILKPVDLDSMTNEYQTILGARDLGNSVEVKLSYNLVQSYEGQISANPNWHHDYQKMDDYLKPGKTADWDEQMRNDLLVALKKDGIEPEKLTDKELVIKTSAWIFSKFAYDNFFVPYIFSFRDGGPKPIAGTDTLLNSIKQQYGISSNRDVIARGLSGRHMFYSRTHGDCTASSILVSTIFRALGIPTRIVLTVPAVDIIDRSQREKLAEALGSNADELILKLGLNSLATLAQQSPIGSFVAHTFNEVFVGNEWVKLNYTQLGQGNIWSSMGLITQVNTFGDWADAYSVVESWGAHFVKGQLGGKITNPYSSSSIEKQVP